MALTYIFIPFITTTELFLWTTVMSDVITHWKLKEVGSKPALFAETVTWPNRIQGKKGLGKRPYGITKADFLENAQGSKSDWSL